MPENFPQSEHLFTFLVGGFEEVMRLLTSLRFKGARNRSLLAWPLNSAKVLMVIKVSAPKTRNRYLLIDYSREAPFVSVDEVN